MRRPFMDTPEQLASLDGQQYLVLRPAGPVAALYEREQDAALRRADVRWAAAQSPIEVAVEAVDVFPEPWQILILRLVRSSSLVAAYASLTRALEVTDFRRLGELSLEDWTFHLSVLYGKTLSPDEWDALATASVRNLADRPSETIDEIELVSYAGGVEHAEVIRLGG